MGPEEMRELDALRARAYGPSADIADDPEAATRLIELERAAAAMRSRRTDALLVPARSLRSPVSQMQLGPGLDSDLGSNEPTRSAPVSPDRTDAGDRSVPLTTPAVPQRSRRQIVVGVIAVFAAVVLFAGGLVVGRAMSARDAAYGSTVLARLPVDSKYTAPAALQGSAVAIVAGFRDFHGLRAILGRGAWFGTNSSEYCLFVYPEAFVVDVAAPNYTGPQWTGCGAGSFPPEAQLDITGDLPESVRAPFTGPTALQFVYDATTHEVVVFVAT